MSGQVCLLALEFLGFALVVGCIYFGYQLESMDTGDQYLLVTAMFAVPMLGGCPRNTLKGKIA